MNKYLYRQANGADAPVVAQHTPGPWIITNPIDEEQFADIQSLNGGLYLRAKWGDKCRRLLKGEKSRLIHQLEIDACLITAAPDLLRALQGLIAVVKDGISDPEDIDIYQQALAIVARANGANL